MKSNRIHSIVKSEELLTIIILHKVCLDHFGKMGKDQLLVVQWVRVCRLWSRPTTDTRMLTEKF